MKNELLAAQLLQLIKEHKESCDKPDCGINTFMFLELYEQLKGEKTTQEEFRVFM